jgi:hypothetical protein
MEIWVEFDRLTAKFRTSPEPATVKRGTPVKWRFRTDNSQETARIRWSVYFKPESNPFGYQRPIFSTLSGEADGQHSATTGIVFADTPGDYKYGVRAEDMSTEKELGNDDPWLKVSA